MKTSNLFKYSFTVGMQQWRVASIVYFFQLCLALTLGMQVHSVLESSIGHSLELNKLLHGYDHTVITDFLKVHGASITPLLGQLRWLLMTWFVFSVFINGGLLYCSVMDPTNSSPVMRFWTGGASYFFPFLKISLAFLVLALVWTLLIWIPVALFFEPSLQYFSSEKYIVWISLCMMVLSCFGLLVVFIWSVTSRLMAIQAKASTIQYIKKGWMKFWPQKGAFTKVMLTFILLQIALLAGYCVLKCFAESKTGWGILALFVIQQGFIFFRIQIRQMMYVGISQIPGK